MQMLHAYLNSRECANFANTNTPMLYIRVIEFSRNFEFRNWHAMRGGLMLPDSISEEKLEID